MTVDALIRKIAGVAAAAAAIAGIPTQVPANDALRPLALQPPPAVASVFALAPVPAPRAERSARPRGQETPGRAIPVPRDTPHRTPALAPRSNRVAVWDRIADCESSGDWSINTGNGYYGGLQILPSTWRAYGGGRYAELPHRASKAQQIAVAEAIRAGQGWGAWPVCSREAGVR